MQVKGRYMDKNNPLQAHFETLIKLSSVATSSEAAFTPNLMLRHKHSVSHSFQLDHMCYICDSPDTSATAFAADSPDAKIGSTFWSSQSASHCNSQSCVSEIWYQQNTANDKSRHHPVEPIKLITFSPHSSVCFHCSVGLGVNATLLIVPTLSVSSPMLHQTFLPCAPF